MAFVFSSLVCILLCLGIIYWYITRNNHFWKRRNIPYLKPQPLFGNIRDVILFKRSINYVFQDLYNELNGQKYGGIFQMSEPALLLRDPEIIKSVMVKDFSHFQDRGFHIDEETNPLSRHLFLLGGWKWRILRMKLTPTFTSGKMKMMFKVIEECSTHLQKYLSDPASKGEILEMKEVLAKFSTDVIGTCAFGLQMNALENPDSEFRRMGRKIFDTSSKEALRRIVASFLPGLAKMLRFSAFDPEVNDFFLKVVRETVEYRETNDIKRNDFLHLLIELKNKGKIESDSHDKDEKNVLKEIETDLRHDDEKILNMDHTLLAAQVFVFFLAGFETSSSTMSFALHELAVNPDMQTRLREEIDRTLEECGGTFTYDAIMNMKYLDKIISETLRKYPPLGILTREVTIPYNLPGMNVTLEKGTKVIVPVYALHHDPKYYPNPERFDPERFSDENKAERSHYVYLPFGEGPRNCIGLRFGLLQTKMGLSALISKYEFHVCERTELPIIFNPKAGVTSSYTGTIVRVTDRT